MEKGKALNKALAVAVSASMAVSLGAPFAWGQESSQSDEASAAAQTAQPETQTEQNLQQMIQSSAQADDEVQGTAQSQPKADGQHATAEPLQLSSASTEDNTAVTAEGDAPQSGETEAVENAAVQGAKAQYASVGDAIQAGDTSITLLRDVTEDVVVPASANVTLDLAGHTLTNNADHTIFNNGTLTIKDSSEGQAGVVDNVSNGKAAVYNNINATATITGGTFTRSQEHSASDGGENSWYVVKNFGAMTIADGTFQFSQEQSQNSSLISNGWYSAEKAEAGSSDEPKPSLSTDKAQLTINGGSFTGGKLVVKNDDYGTLAINGGTFTQPTASYYTIQNVNVATITGGTFNSGAQAQLFYVVSLGNDVNNGATSITGGTFNAQDGVFKYGAKADGAPSAEVSGGFFNGSATDVDAYLAPGFAYDKDTGAITADAAHTVATVAYGDTTVNYATFEAAVAGVNAYTGDGTPVVTLTRDYTKTAPTGGFTHSVVVNLGDYRLTGADSTPRAADESSEGQNSIALFASGEGVELTVNATDKGGVTGGKTPGAESLQRGAEAVRAQLGAHVVINGGTYTNQSNSDLLYSIKDGTFTINGGHFSTQVQDNGFYYVLNANNSNTVNAFTVNGGTFENYDPAQGDDNMGTKWGSFLPAGKGVTKAADGSFAVSDATAQVSRATGDKSHPLESVAAYGSFAEAAAAAQAGQTVTLVADAAEKVPVDKQVSLTAASGVTFRGQLSFSSAAAGSTVRGMNFVLDEQSEGLGVSDSVVLNGTNDVAVTDNTFTVPSRLWGVYGEGGYSDGKSWQPNGVRVASAQNVTVQGNTFALGRTNEQTNDTANPIESDATVGVNVVGPNVKNVTVDDNTLNVTAPAAEATKDASVSLVIANGNVNDDPNAFGVDGLAITGNTFKGQAGQFGRLAGVSDVTNMTVTGNNVTDAKYGVIPTNWQNKSDVNTNVAVGGNTYTNVEMPFYSGSDTTAKVETTGALVKTADGAVTDYATLADAAAAAEAGSTVTLLGTSSDNATFNTQVTVNAINKDVVYRGSMTFGADADGSTVDGVTFERNTNSVILQSGLDGMTVSNCAFTVTKDEGVSQANAIWAIDGGITNLAVTGNTFTAQGDSTVGLNIQNVGVENVTVSGNTLTDEFGNAGLVNAFGKAQDNGGTGYGITNLAVTGNTVNGAYGKRLGAERTNCATVRNVSGVTFEGNTLNNVYIGLSFANWDGYQHSMSTGITVNKNTFTDSLAPVYLMPETTSNDVSYGTGENANIVKQSKYQQVAPIALTASGEAFAGWYADQSLTAPATDANAPAYAKWLPTGDVYELDYIGRSLNKYEYLADYDGHKKGDPYYGKTDLRFSHTFKVQDGFTQGEFGWDYGTDSKMGKHLVGTNKVDQSDGSVRTNLLIQQITVDKFDVDVYEQFYFVYKTPDGTDVTVKAPVKQSSVIDVADAIIAAEHEQVPGDKVFAQGLKDAYAASVSEQ